MTDSEGPRASIIIPHLNTPQLLARCLASIALQRLDKGWFEIIVVDNGSAPGMLDAIRQAAEPEVKFLLEPQPGPGLARNRGAAAARSNILAFIDADCRAEAGWLQAAVDAIEAGGDDAVVGGDIRIDFVDDKRPTAVEAFEAVFGFRQKMYIERRNFSVTANLAMARGVHAAVGPFGGIDMAEDFDWGQRAAAKGFKTRFVPAMRVYHPARADYPALKRKWARLIAQERTGFIERHEANAKWLIRACMVGVSALPDSLKMLLSFKLKGLHGRFGGLVVLWRIRLFRAAEMWRQASQRRSADSLAWNR